MALSQSLSSKTKDAQADTRAQRAELQRQETLIAGQQDRLLNLRIDGQIKDDTFNRKQTELRDRLASIKLHSYVLDRSRDENAELASRVFNLLQTLRQWWFTADYAQRRNIQKIVWLNCRLVDASLCPTIIKPFDVLAEGLLVPESGGGRTPIELFLTGVREWTSTEIQLAKSDTPQFVPSKD